MCKWKTLALDDYISCLSLGSLRLGQKPSNYLSPWSVHL
jgi:hypothetical protein